MVSHKFRVFLGRFLVTGLFVAIAGFANAAVLDEVVVTAQKREQDSQDVGIAINAFTGEQMKTLGVTQSFDIATFAPGIHISGNLAGQNTQFSIRGVTQNDYADIVEAPNAVYLDEGYFAIAQAQTFAVFDIERVEMLKGPQGTLFGRNATGGMVQYISNKPNLTETEAYIDVSYGQFDVPNDANALRVEGAVSVPFITDKLAGRVAIMHSDQDPYLENLYPQEAFGAATFGFGPGNSPGPGAGADLGDDDTLALRGILQFEPREDLRFTFSVNHAETDVSTGPYQSKPTSAVYSGSSPSPGQILSQGELVNVIDTAPNDSRLSICADGSDCGSDQDNNGFPDDLNGDTLLDQARITNGFALSPGTDFFGYKDPDGDDFTFSGDFAFDDSGHTETTAFQLRNEFDMAGGSGPTLTTIVDYKEYEKLLFIDVDSAPVNQLVNYAGVDADSLTVETRLNGESENSRWVAGLYYLNIDSDADNGLKIPDNSVAGGPPRPPGSPPRYTDVGVDGLLETDSYSIFGQYEYDFTEQWMLTVGARWIREEKDGFIEQNLYDATGNSRGIHASKLFTIGPDFPGGVPTGFKYDADDDFWAGKLQIDYKPTDDWLLYFGANRGVKAGSVNMPLAGGLPLPTSVLPYKEEVLLSFEGGFKSTWNDGLTRLNGSIFYYDYDDYQAFLFTGVGGIVINADAETVGAELELQTSPMDGLDLLLSAAWFDAEVKDVPFRAPVFDQGTGAEIGNVIRRDVKPTYAPELQFSGLARYQWQLWGGYASVQGDFSYSDDYYYNLRNFDADQFDSYVLVNARLGWATEDERWAFAIDLRNLTDERAGIQGFDLATLCGCNEVSYRAPRYAGLNVKYEF